MKKIIFVSHCILNTASKVVLYNQTDMDAEENLRKKFMHKAIDQEVQIIQLPCPEFRDHCRKILAPCIQQLKEYLANEDWFEVLGIVGVDGSPSCGVDYTCCADWYGSFECREGLDKTFNECTLEKKSGIFMQVLKEMLKENGLSDKVKVTSLFAPEPEKCLEILDK